MGLRAQQRVLASGAAGAALCFLAACGGGGSSSSGSTVPSAGASQGSASGSSASGGSSTGGQRSGGAPTHGQDATAAVIQSAQIPADCNMPAMRLSGGKTASRYSPAQGQVVSGDDGSGPLLVDMTGAGSKQVLWRYSCSAGGVEWPEVLVLSDAHGNLVGNVDLNKIAQAEHAEVTGWHVDGKNVSVDWKQYEGAAFDEQDHHGTLSWSGGKLQLSNGGSSAGKNPNVPSGAAPGAGGARPSGATPLTEKYSDQYSSMPAFKTPSGNNGCQVNSGWIRCGTTGGSEIFLSPDGQIESPQADDAPIWPQADQLAYEQVRYQGDTVFASTRQGVTVWNTKTGHGALINTSGIQQF